MVSICWLDHVCDGSKTWTFFIIVEKSANLPSLQMLRVGSPSQPETEALAVILPSLFHGSAGFQILESEGGHKRFELGGNM